MVTYPLSHLTQPNDQRVGGPIQDDEALLLFAVVRVMRLKRILEFGSLNGYSARNFLEALQGKGAVYSVDISEVPKLAPNHVTIRRDVAEIVASDVDEIPLDLIFFDCHAYDAQLEAYQRLRSAGLVTDRTILAFHDTNLHPQNYFNPSYPAGDGWRHVDVEPRLVNRFKQLGYDMFSLHTKMFEHSEELPFRWGLTIASRFKPLAVDGIDPADYTVLDVSATENDIETMFRAVLKRPVGNDEYRKDLAASGISIRQLLVNMRGCHELKSQVQKELSETEGYSNLGRPATESDIEALFQVIVKRSADDEGYKRNLIATGVTSRQLLAMLRDSIELKNLTRIEHERAEIEGAAQRQHPAFFRCPQNLVVAPTDIRRILIVGSCLSSQLTRMRPGCDSEFYSFGQELSEYPLQPVKEYNFQVVQLPLRSVLPDCAFARLTQTDIEGHEQLFAHAASATRELLGQAMKWNRHHGILTFVFPFLLPQQNAVGRLMRRYDLRNPVYFIERLNMIMEEELENYSNAYLFDVNEILSSYGKRYVQEDMVWALNHASYLTDFDARHDVGRAEPASSATQLYQLDVQGIMIALWEELLAAYRTVRQEDSVKMVVVDLDDTLWRGTVAEVGVEDLPTSEGWPIGLWEALAILKRRGILLAIISRNDEALVTDVWDHILGRNLALDDFAIRRINWLPKSENMADILAQVNLLPESIVYIDDNPTQRAEIKAAFPEIRVLGGSPLTWRHILLWSAETQVRGVTTESASRTQMVQAQVAREEQRRLLPREEFLASLNVRMDLFCVNDVSHKRFARVLELLNKTNQFNTTGRRWTQDECAAAFLSGTRFHAFELADRYTKYGLVGVLVTDEIGIHQFVMSCRVMALEAELAAVAVMVGFFRERGAASIRATMVETERNLPCRDVYARCGFEPAAGGWERATVPAPPIPAHIALYVDGTAAVAAQPAERLAGLQLEPAG